ncbi:MAG: hypothetical protein QXT39_07280 [Conexivisphaerales archaeon]
MLEQNQVEWIVRSKSDGKRKNRDIAYAMGVSVSRVQQLYREYRRTGKVPVLKKAGRHRSPDITEYERRIVKEMYGIYRLCACYLEEVLLARGVRINHNRIHRILVMEGLALNEPRKHVRKKWIRYEREHSNSLWHADWHEIKGHGGRENGLYATKTIPPGWFLDTGRIVYQPQRCPWRCSILPSRSMESQLPYCVTTAPPSTLWSPLPGRRG